MKTMKILISLMVFVIMGFGANAQSKKDTTVVFKADIHCMNCKAKVEKNIPYEKGVKDFKVDMEKQTISITYRPDKNDKENLKKAIEKHDVKVLGTLDKDGKVNAPSADGCSGCTSKDSECAGKCGDGCCSKTGNKDNCCKNKK